MSNDEQHFVYIVECSDGTLYTGYTKNIKQRIKKHNSEKAYEGAKYTQGRRPVKLQYKESYSSQSKAQSREYSIKQMSRSRKKALINSSD